MFAKFWRAAATCQGLGLRLSRALDAAGSWAARTYSCKSDSRLPEWWVWWFRLPATGSHINNKPQYSHDFLSGPLPLPDFSCFHLSPFGSIIKESIEKQGFVKIGDTGIVCGGCRLPVCLEYRNVIISPLALLVKLGSKRILKVNGIIS